MKEDAFEKVLATYDYVLPEDLIAKTPASPRDSARLLIYDRNNDTVHLDIFRNIGSYLPQNAVLVLNDTKVFPARMTLKKKTGGMISALYLKEDGDQITVFATGTLRPGETLQWGDHHAFRVVERKGKEAVLIPDFPITELPTLLEQFGETPLPPYIQESPLTESDRRSEYQTVFAADRGSIAAPTAGLHFTEELLKQLTAQGFGLERVTLHAHLGTFAPLEEKQWEERKLHTERYAITPETAERLNTAKKSGRPIIAVGTTTVRTLESACSTATTYALQPALSLSKGPTPSSLTSLFITEQTPLHFVDHLITNFHLPRSSLLMLVSAFTGREKLMSLYKKAVEERMRFFSFGDAMLVLS